MNTMVIRQLSEKDFKDLDRYFGASTVYKKPPQHWQNYLHQQERGERAIRVVEVNDHAVGFGTLKFVSEYPWFRSMNIPEINDVLIASEYRNRGYGRALISALEKIAQQGDYKTIGLGVGLYQDYGQAQRLYVKMGYVPDGRGITYNNQPVIPGQAYSVDDDLLQWLTKSLELKRP